jgi:DNA uptake protein ComE-like DNA-binding protein
MKRFVFWTAGIVLGVWAVNQVRRAGARLSHAISRIDLNQCSREDLLGVPGITEPLADRIIENRPYRHRLDLVARMVIPSGIYQQIRDLVDVADGTANKSVNVAS